MELQTIYKKYIELLLEFKRQDIEYLKNYDNYFNIGIEIELEKLEDTEKEINKNFNFSFEEKNLKALYTFLPTFTQLNEKNIIIKEDSSLSVYGFEIVSKIFHSYSDTLFFINSFFDDFEKQNSLFFNKNTAIHFNISFNSEFPFNYMKLFLFLNETTNSGEAGFAYKEFEERIKNKYCKNIKSKIFERIKAKSKNYSVHDFNEIIKDYFKNEMLIKTSGLAIRNINSSSPYVEFRYVGGDKINRKKILDKLNYFCYLILLSKTNLKNEDYIKKLYKFIDNINK